jgi:hypothetical protein
MAERIQFFGKSGQSYTFQRIADQRFLPPAGANVLIAHRAPDGWRILHAGETGNLAEESWRPTLNRALGEHPQAEALYRLNVTRAVRRAEMDDLVQQHAPPMNLQQA